MDALSLGTAVPGRPLNEKEARLSTDKVCVYCGEKSPNYVNAEGALCHKACLEAANKVATKKIGEVGTEGKPRLSRMAMERQQAHAAMVRVLERGIHAIQVYTLKEDSKGHQFIKAGVTSYGSNAWTRKCLNEIPEDKVLHLVEQDFTEGTLRVTATSKDGSVVPALDDYIKLELTSSKRSAKMMRAIVANGLLVQTLPGVQRLWVRTEGGLTYYHTVGNGFPSFMQYRVGAPIRKDGKWVKYGNPFAGPSNERQTSCFLFKWNPGEPREEFNKRWVGIMDLCNGGLMSQLMLKRHLKYEKAYKLKARLALGWTPQTPFLEIHKFAYLCGSFGKDVPGSKITWNCGDGQAIINSLSGAERLTELSGFNVTEAGFASLAPQGRTTGASGKGLMYPKRNWAIKSWVRSFKSLKEELTFKEFKGKYDAGELKEGTLYVVGEGERIDVILDDDSLKAMGDLESGMVLNILDVFGRSKGKMNGQVANCSMHLPEAVDYLKGLGQREFIAEIKEIVDGLGGEEGAEPIAPKMYPVDPTQYSLSLIEEICPRYAYSDPALYRNIVFRKGEKLVKTISRLNMSIPNSFYLRSRTDMVATMFGRRLLPNRKVYIFGAPEDDCVITRNPKVGNIEYYPAENVGLSWIYKRLDEMQANGELTAEQVRIAKREYADVGEGFIIIPADPEFPDRTGGSDTDGDGHTVTFDKTWVNIQTQQSLAELVKIPGAPATGRMVEEMSIESILSMTLDGLFGPLKPDAEDPDDRTFPETVGAINNACTAQKMALTRKDLIEWVAETCRLNAEIAEPYPEVEAYRAKRKTTAYRRRFKGIRGEITNDMVYKAALDFYTSDFSLRSVKNALEDAELIGIRSVGSGIDSKKNGENVYTFFLGLMRALDFRGERIKGGTRLVAGSTINWEVKKRFGANGVPYLELTDDRREGCEYLPDPLSEWKEGLLREIVETINEFAQYEVELPEAERDDLDSGIYEDAISRQDVDFISQSFGKITGGGKFMSSKAKAEMLSCLENMARTAFKPGTKAFVRYLAMRAAACRGNNQYSGMAHLLREEAVRAAAYYGQKSGYTTNLVVGFEVFGQSEAKSVKFTDGMADGFISRSHFDGTYTVKQYGHRLFAVKTVHQYFTVQSNNEDAIIMANSYNPKGFGFWNRQVEVTKLGTLLGIFAQKGDHRIVTTDGQSYGLVVGNGKVGETRLTQFLNGHEFHVGRVLNYADNNGEHTLISGKLGERLTAPQQPVDEVKA